MGSFAAGLLASGPRILPLEAPRGYRDAASTKLSVAFARHAPCASCAGKGCFPCSWAGWHVEATTIEVPVPAGAMPGTRVIVDGAGAISVEIVEPGPRAEELRAAQADFERKLATARAMDGAAKLRRKRRRWGLVVIVVVVVALMPFGRWMMKDNTGEACRVDDDCRSNQCVGLYSRNATGSGPRIRIDGRVCTSSCETDLDCPRSMHCAGARSHDTDSVQYVELGDGLFCVPNGY